MSWLTLSDCTRTRLAKDLGVSTARISQLLTSGEQPSAHLMAKLVRRTNLPLTRLFRIVDRKPALTDRLSRKTVANGRRHPGGVTTLQTVGH